MTLSQRAVEAAAEALSRTFCDHWFGPNGLATKHKMTRDFVNGSYEWKAEAKAALTAALAVDGLCLVPKEPTREMVNAGCNSRVDGWNDSYYDDEERSEILEWVKEGYAAMIAAASDGEEQK